jgi:hypothetical protein
MHRNFVANAILPEGRHRLVIRWQELTVNGNKMRF